MLKRKPKVLHITGDYPDPHRETTTKAIKHLIDRTENIDHLVFSLNRTANPFNTYFKPCGRIDGGTVVAYSYWGLPFAILLTPTFFIIACSILFYCKKTGFKPDVIHAHRMTFDGIAAWFLSLWWGVPYVLAVRGEVDTKVYRFKPICMVLMRKIIKKASRIYLVSMWFKPWMERQTPFQQERASMFPNIIENACDTIPITQPNEAFVSVLNLNIYEKKGLPNLLKAMQGFCKKYPRAKLDIFGTGTLESCAAVETLIESLSLQKAVNLKGQITNHELTQTLSSYKAMVLPSHNETFGMVYTEALFAGTPILYSKETGIDGYLDDITVGVGVNPNAVNEIEAALDTLWNENSKFRRTISGNSNVLFDRFDAQTVINKYENDIQSLMI